MGPAAPTLTALEVTVATWPRNARRAQLVGVHRQAHGTACQTPFKTGVDEDLGQTLFFGLGTHKTRPGNDHGPHAVLDLFALQDRQRQRRVFDPPVGAGADEHRVDLDVGQLCAGRQAHVVERPLRRIDLAALKVRRGRDNAGDRQDVFGRWCPR